MGCQKLGQRYLLQIFHLLYVLIQWVKTVRDLIKAGAFPLERPRSKIPRHVSLYLAVDNQDTARVINTVRHFAASCFQVGVQEVSVFDQQDMLSGALQQNSRSSPAYKLPFDTLEANDDPCRRYSWKAFASRFSGAKQSLPIGCLTELYTHKVVTIISPRAGKPSVASASQWIASSLLKNCQVQGRFDNMAFNKFIEDTSGLSSPDLVLISDSRGRYRGLKLHGYPPWHISLSEICHTSDAAGAVSLSKETLQKELCAALDIYGCMEMRFGK